MGKNAQVVFIVLLGLLFSSFVSAELYTKDNMKIDMTISSTLDFTGSPNEIHLFLYDYPKVAAHTISIPGKIDGNAVYYYWRTPASPVSYSVQSRFDTSQQIAEVREKIPMSVAYSADLENYTKPSLHIDSGDPAIRAM